MKIINTVADMRALRMLWQHNKQRVAFVPTMGNLHSGHLDLVRHAKANADVVVVSIFVNPLQFGANEDLDKYPRTFAGDCEALQALDVDAVFAPTPEVMYPKGLEQQTFVEVPSISSIICGASRPGHFRGVATVVCKLFNMVMPDEAFFGEKDFQQLQVIRQMVEDLDLPVNVNGIATVRDPDGLALSSRNQYLTTQERQKATAIYQCLVRMTTALSDGNGEVNDIVACNKQSLTGDGFVVDYIEVRNAKTLQPFGGEDNQGVVLIAAFLGNTRLIDNLCFTVAGKD